MKPQTLFQIFILTTLLFSGCAPAGEPTREPTPTPWVAPESQATPTAVALTQMAPGTVILSWQREGGIAGFCDEVVVRLDGGFTSGTCAQPGLYSAKLSAEDLALVMDWVISFQSFRHANRDPAVADAMTIKLDFVGTGTAQAGEAERAAMSIFAAQLLPNLQPDLGGGSPPSVLKARRLLAEQLKIGLDQVSVTQIEPVDWPDACLGLAQTDELCAQVITPGFRVLIAANGLVYEFRTDLSGENLRRSPEAKPVQPAG